MKFTSLTPWVGCDPSTLSSGPKGRRARRGIDVTDGPAVRPYLTRRAFIRTVTLAGIAGLSWLLLRRSCAGSGACNSCSQFAGCGLPWKVNRP